MQPRPQHGLLLIALLLTACGIPRQAAPTAQANAAALAAVPDEDAAIRAALLNQGDAWTQLAALTLDQEFGGLTGIDPKFTALVLQTAALARRQSDLIAQNQDDPQQNRLALQKLRALAQEAATYLNP